MKQRIEDILSYSGMSSSQFAEAIGIQRSALSHILNGRNNASLDVVLKIHQRFPEVSLEWILTGTGEMMSASSSSSPVLQETHASYPPQQPGLFDENPEFMASPTEDRKNLKEIASTPPEITPGIIEKEVIKYIDKPAAKIIEIKIFYDNGTFLTFYPEK